MDAFHKAGFIISYADILLLHNVWGLEYVSESRFIPREIAKDVPAIFIADNDFKIDKLIGNSQQAHQTNAMFVQHQSNEHKSTVKKWSFW